MKILIALSVLVLGTAAHATCPLSPKGKSQFAALKFDVCAPGSAQVCVKGVLLNGQTVTDALAVKNCGPGYFHCVFQGRLFEVEKYAVDERGNSIAEIRSLTPKVLLAACP